MKKINTKRVLRTLFILISFIIIYIFCISIANNLILTPIINYLADSETSRIFVSCLLGWFGMSTLFNLIVEGKSK